MSTQSNEYIPRRAEATVRSSLELFRVVFVNGPRQAGKTTLVRRLADEMGGTYHSLDDPETLDAARRDPTGFASVPGLVVIDEVQRAGDPILLAIKSRVDRDTAPGQFILTGSARFLTVPRISESLAGRVEIIDLWPLSQGEIEGTKERFVDRLLTSPESMRDAARGASRIDRDSYWSRVCSGGYPAVLRLPSAARGRWFRAYVQTLTQREILDVARVRHPGDLPRLVRLLAASTGRELNVNALTNDLQLSWSTVDGYLSLLETLFVWTGVPSWSRNLRTRVVGHRKAHVTDTGLAAFLLGADERELANPMSKVVGRLTETFVAGELARQMSWSEADTRLHHYRDKSREVDLVLEAPDGRVAAIEVKSGASASRADFAALSFLRDRVGSAFVQGAVLYTGHEVLSFGDDLSLLPISSLWAG
ncbi:MAG: ATP-binding protein [Actinomycetota bacterium]